MPDAIATLPQSPLIKAISATGRMPNPLPLLTTHYDVEIRGGLAVVTEQRQFRNCEEESVEATLTFPIPVHAVLFELSAEIDHRKLTAHVKKSDAARQVYETAIDRGKFTVLHEEVLRGVHMLSVGHLPPNEPVIVTSRWCASLAWINDQAQLRIPVTVGEIYGTSPLSDSDDMISGGPEIDGSVAVRSVAGTVVVNGRTMDHKPVAIVLDRPIDIQVAAWQPDDLAGVSHDGRNVAVAIEPANSAKSTVDVAVVVDRSGSMESEIGGGQDTITTHESVCLGLRSAAAGVPPQSRIDLWEFDNSVDLVGSACDSASLRTLVDQLSAPGGGTEIGRALEHVASNTAARDIVLITDGKSYDLNVQDLARKGKRVTVVLVGEDSLEANVGHLAALTGGEILVALGDDVGAAVAAAFAAANRSKPQAVEAGSDAITQFRSGMMVSARWSTSTRRSRVHSAADNSFDRAVAAYAASLHLPHLEASTAADMAESEGIVSHLTSLVLTDHDGNRHTGLPETRKVALSGPRNISFAIAATMPAREPADARSMAPMRVAKASLVRPARLSLACARAAVSPTARRDGSKREQSLSNGKNSSKRPEVSAAAPEVLFASADSAVHGIAHSDHRALHLPSFNKLTGLARELDWSHVGKRIKRGDLSHLSPRIATRIRMLTEEQSLKRIASGFKLDPTIFIVGLLARMEAPRNRAAERLSRRIFKDVSNAVIDQIIDELSA